MADAKNSLEARIQKLESVLAHMCTRLPWLDEHVNPPKAETPAAAPAVTADTEAEDTGGAK